MTSFPPLITPTLTGRSTVLMLFIGLVLSGTNARSGMKAPKGTFMKRLLSTSQTEYTSAWAGAGVGALNAKTPTTAARTARPTRSQDRFLIFPPDRTDG